MIVIHSCPGKERVDILQRKQVGGTRIKNVVQEMQEVESELEAAQGNWNKALIRQHFL